MVGLLYDRGTRCVDIDCRTAGVCSGFNGSSGRRPVDVLAHILDPMLEYWNASRRLGSSIMRRALFGLALLPLIACSSAASESVPPNSLSGVSQKAEPPPPNQTHRTKNSNHGSRTQSGGRPVPGSLPLSTATAYATEHSPSFPISTVPKAAPQSNSWTGFFIGAGAGASTPQP